jgi:hypothetical protein
MAGKDPEGAGGPGGTTGCGGELFLAALVVILASLAALLTG